MLHFKVRYLLKGYHLTVILADSLERIQSEYTDKKKFIKHFVVSRCLLIYINKSNEATARIPALFVIKA